MPNLMEERKMKHPLIYTHVGSSYGNQKKKEKKEKEFIMQLYL